MDKKSYKIVIHPDEKLITGNKIFFKKNQFINKIISKDFSAFVDGNEDLSKLDIIPDSYQLTYVRIFNCPHQYKSINDKKFMIEHQNKKGNFQVHSLRYEKGR